MRFMLLIKSDEQAEAGVLPDEKVFAAMGKYNDDLAQAGALLAAEGLHPSARGARIKFRGGVPAVTDGPFAEAKEVIAGYWLIQAGSKQEAIEWALRVPFEAAESSAARGGEGEIEVRRLFELEDFPVSEGESGWREQEAGFRAANPSGFAHSGKPGEAAGAGPLKRFVILRKADRETEAGVMPSEALLAAMGQYNEEMLKAGLLLGGEGLRPSAQGARVKYSAGIRTVTDGPFTEAKELVAGFTLIQARSKDEALAWAKRWPAIDGQGEAELELRQVFDESDFPPELVQKMPEAFAAEREARERAAR